MTVESAMAAFHHARAELGATQDKPKKRALWDAIKTLLSCDQIGVPPRDDQESFRLSLLQKVARSELKQLWRGLLQDVKAEDGDLLFAGMTISAKESTPDDIVGILRRARAMGLPEQPAREARGRLLEHGPFYATIAQVSAEVEKESAAAAAPTDTEKLAVVGQRV
jgi:hypothetical protein